MSDEQERPEDTVRRFAGVINELQAWQQKYRQAAELMDALTVDKNDIIVDMVLIARMVSPTEQGSILSTSATDDVDLTRQLGMLAEANLIIHKMYLFPDRGD